MAYVHSTASQPMNYPIYADGPRQGQARKIKDILIKGTANVIDPHTLFTPTGAVTEISDEDLEMLKKSPAFQRHVAKGFMKVIDKSELDTTDMQKRDNSAQLNDYEYANDLDPRVPRSGDCQAQCGENNRVVGARGKRFIGDSY